MQIKIYSLLLFALLFTACGKITLPKLITDGMVLQRNAEIKIWGWAKSNQKISINFLDSVYCTKVDNEGEWEIIMSDLKAGGPYSMVIKGGNTIKINNILIGDVWICSGQSNMEINMKRVSPLYEDEITKANNPNIRYFNVPKAFNFQGPQNDMQNAEWIYPNQETILSFAAVPYFFAQELYNIYKVPIGIINASLGGSPTESWLSEEALKKFPDHYNELQRFKNDSLICKIRENDNIRINNWYKKLRKNDEGYKNIAKPWFTLNLDVSNWNTMNIPGYWANGELGDINGVVWFRKEIEISEKNAGKPAKLNLGRIIDADSVFVNEVFIGSVGYQYPPRRYEIPENVLKEGKNVIVVRVISNIGRGGFVLDKPYELIVNEKVIDLKGEWKYKLGAEMPSLQSQTFIRWKPGGLYNAMISPLLNYKIKGVVWYQGESNTDDPEEHNKLFSTLINSWRKEWGGGDFPFLYVQLPNFMETKDEPTESNWAEFRETQLKALSFPNTAMVVAIDIGEWNDIHPLNKKDVGKRLALAARKIAYDEDIVYSGPVYKSMEITGNKIILSFKNTGSGLFINDGENLNEFAIAGKDKRFKWAKAILKDDKVIVWTDKITNPVAVRYAWADNPDKANLYNKEGLPASPFRTDDW